MSRELLTNQLRALYGSRAQSAAPQLFALLDEAGRQIPGQRVGVQLSPLSEQDVLLITYADQVRSAGELPLRTLARFAETHLCGVISGIHILPFYPWSSDDGFAVKDFFAVDPAYGTWAEITALSRRFDLMFDAVLNHMSAQSDWFRRFLNDEPAYRDFFVTVSGDPCLTAVIRPRALPLLTAFQGTAGPRKVWTTFSSDQVDLNYANPDVLLAAVRVLLFYVAQGARFIRLDAIAFLWKEIGTCCLHLPQTHRIVQFLRAVLDQVAPGVRLITETNVPHTDNISYFGDGTNEAQLVYNFALPPLVLHSFHTGNAEKLTRWAQSLALPTTSVSFFNFLASHDGIGVNPARGILSDAEIDAMVAGVREAGGLVSYKTQPDGSTVPYELNINFLDALSPPHADEPASLAAQKFVTSQAIMLSLQGVPGIYFHSLFGSRGDVVAAKESGINRRINRQKSDFAALEAELADPQSLRRHVFTEYSALLRRRRAHPALSPQAPQQVLNLDPRVFAVQRESVEGGRRLWCLHNISQDLLSVRCPGWREAVVLEPFGFRWLEQ